MPNEVELKFDVESGGGDAVRAADPLQGAEASQGNYDSVYYDTEDGALRRAGFSLRVRESKAGYIQAVKRKKASSAGLFIRQEWEAEVARFELDPAAFEGTPLQRWLERHKPLRLIPLVRTRFHRTAWQVSHDGSRIEVVLDEGTITGGDKEAPISELELELIEGKPAPLFVLAQSIGTAAPLRLGVLSKSERGYALAEGKLGRASKAEPIRLEPLASEADAFHAVAHACLRHFRLNEIVLLEHDEADALHQARVALRRLRAALTLFRPTVRGADYQYLREELRWFAAQFGDARNADVLIERFAAEQKEIPAELNQTRDAAYGRVADALRSDRARQLMLRFALWLETGAWRFRGRGAQPVRQLAADQLERRWRKIARRGGDLTRLTEEELHRLRIDVKKVRYAAEFLSSLYRGKPVATRRDSFVAALKALQERLGEINDAWTAQQQAAQLAPELRQSMEDLHPEKSRRRALREAGKALRRADASAGFWLAQPIGP